MRIWCDLWMSTSSFSDSFQAVSEEILVSHLYISNVRDEDFHQYTFVAENRVSVAAKEIELKRGKCWTFWVPTLPNAYGVGKYGVMLLSHYVVMDNEQRIHDKRSVWTIDQFANSGFNFSEADLFCLSLRNPNFSILDHPCRLPLPVLDVSHIPGLSSAINSGNIVKL